jgi:hypothetical protein
VDTKRAVRLARFVERASTDLSATDVQARRKGRIERIQDAWLRDLSVRSWSAAARELRRRRAGSEAEAPAPPDVVSEGAG